MQKLILIAAFSLFTSVLYAQVIGLHTGVTLCNYKNITPFNKVKLGTTAGLFYEKKLPVKNLFVQTAVNYNLLVGKGDVNYYNQINQLVLSYEKQQALHYVQIPVQAQWRFLTRDKYSLGLTSGLQYGLLLSARQNPQPKGIDHNITDELNRHLLGFMAGGVFTYALNTKYTLYLNYTYQTNLTSLQSNKSTGFNAQLFTIGLGYHLPEKNAGN